MNYINCYESPIGKLLMISDGEVLTELLLNGEQQYSKIISCGLIEKNLKIFDITRNWLDIYFKGISPDFTPPISMDGISPFRKRVWEIMLTIPYGQIITYGQIANQIANETGRKVSSRAVGGAVGKNAIAIIIPCHRVVGANGNLTGYGGGIDKKITLLRHEGVNFDNLYIPKNVYNGKFN